jgi:hypothetical protein
MMVMPGTTWKDMCEHIVRAKIIRNKETGGVAISWKEIWEYSPTGELGQIVTWYRDACQTIGAPGIS